MRDLGKPAELTECAKSWLNSVRASRLGADLTIVKIAAEIAHLIRGGGLGELGSAIDLSRPANLSESDAVRAVNELVRAGHVELRWRPMNRTTVEFAARQPGDRIIELPAELAPRNADQRQRAEALAGAAVAGMSLADLVSVWAEVLGKALVHAGVDPDRQTGSEFLETVAKLLRSRTKALSSAPQLNS